uniref:glutathione transferase n=1 Tax=Culicoides sonorensis TaxID=179676 RepID=A0A336LN70_CULSO
MAPVLYTMDVGYPTRGLKLVIRNANINVEFRPVDMLNGEHLSPEFLEMNPAHTIPFMKEGDFIINESKAIAQYLIETRAPESALLGRGFAKKRAKVNQMLYFDGTLTSKLTALYVPVLRQGATTVEEEPKKALLETFGILDLYIRKGYWVAGEFLSIADLFLLATIETCVQLGVNLDPYPNVKDWYTRCHKLPGFEENQEGAKQFAEWVKSKLSEELTWPC